MMAAQRVSILFVLLIPLPYPGAAWTRIEFFANCLGNLNYDVRIAGAFSAKTVQQAGSYKMNKIRIYNVVPVINLTNLLALVLNLISSLVVGLFLYILIRPKLTVISVPSGGDTFGFYVMARTFGSKVITDYRDEWEDYTSHVTKGTVHKRALKTLRNLMTGCYRKSKAVITVTDAVANSLAQRGIEGVRIIPNGADVEVFKPQDRLTCRSKFGIPRDCFALIYTGYVGSYYRLDILLHALKDIINRYNSKTILIIVGHGIGLQSFLKLADDEGIRENVFYFGKIVDKPELVNALCASDVGIIPYDSKPLSRHALPVKSLEYLACGLPIVAATYKDSLLGDMMIKNELGIVAEPEKADSLCEAISRIREDVNLRMNMTRRGLSFIRQNYDRNKIATEFHSLVSKCLKNE